MLVVVACSGDDDPAIFKIEDQYKMHVDDFFAEAKARGVSIKKPQLIIQTRDFPGSTCDPDYHKLIKQGDTWILTLRLTLGTDYSRVFIFQSLAHITMNKPYSSVEVDDEAQARDLMYECNLPLLYPDEPTIASHSTWAVMTDYLFR